MVDWDTYNKTYTTPQRIAYYYSEELRQTIIFRQNWIKKSDGTGHYEPQIPPELESLLKCKDIKNKAQEYINCINNLCNKFNLFLIIDHVNKKIDIQYTKNGYYVYYSSISNNYKDFNFYGLKTISIFCIEECYIKLYEKLIENKIKLYATKYLTDCPCKCDYNKKNYNLICDCCKELKKIK